MENDVDKYLGKKYSMETSVVPGVTSIGTVTILGSFRNIGWGDLRCGESQNFHIFNLRVEDNRVTKIEISNVTHFENRDGTPRSLGSRDEVQRTFEVLQGSMIKSEELAEVKKAQKRINDEMQEVKEKRGQEIRAKREQLEEQVRKLSSGKSIQEQITDPGLQKLAVEFAVFDRIYPPRRIR